MCGIAGIISRTSRTTERDILFRGSCSRWLRNRGPDVQNVYRIESLNGLFFHSRLKIVDLTEMSNQPVVDDLGNLLIFNGEIYNAADIGQDLFYKFGKPIRTPYSDTLTLFDALATAGEDWSLNGVDGMFALAFYNRLSHRLSLARDQNGEKPLYIYHDDEDLIFSSDIRVIIDMERDQSLTLDVPAMRQFLTCGYFSHNSTPYEEIRSVNPGIIVQMQFGGSGVNVRWDISEREYQREGECFEESRSFTYSQRLDLLHGELDRAVRKALISDVDVCLALSGGIDSSLVTALASKVQKIEAHTIAFGGSDLDESAHARAVAATLNVPIRVHQFSEGDLAQLIDEMWEAYDLPFADSSQLASLLLCRNISRLTRVALGGDGGDEFFLGYRRHIWPWKLFPVLKWNKTGVFLGLPLNAAGACLTGIEGAWPSIRRVDTYRLFRSRLLSLTDLLLASGDANQIYNAFSSYRCSSDLNLNLNLRESKSKFNVREELISKIADRDITDYLRNDIMVKMDRASMFNSLEFRSPFLMKSIRKASSLFSVGEKLMDGGKAPLKAILSRYIPREVFERPKHGFAIPLERYVLSSLESEIRNSLGKNSFLDKFGVVRQSTVDSMLNDFYVKKNDYQYCIWAMYVLNRWLGTYAGK